MYKGVIFDIDGTLYDYQSNDVHAMKDLCAFVERTVGVDEKTFRATYSQARNIIHERLKDTAASHNRTLMIQTALELLGKNSFNHILQMYDVYWNSFIDNMQPYDGAIDFLRGLKAAGVKISVCTDMTAHVQYRKLAALKLDRYVDFMVTSEETGYEKPAPIMFEFALKKMHVAASEAAYFGDSLNRDIRGAANVGIDPYWFVADRDVSGGDEFKKIHTYRDAELAAKFFGEQS